jgi:hypothetical protein
MSKVKFAGLRTAYIGAPIFTVVTGLLLSGEETSKDISIGGKPIIHATIKKVIVNEIKGIKLPGDREGLVINGGANGLSFSEGDKFVKEIGDVNLVDMGEAGQSTPWIESSDTAYDLCKVVNDGEIIRLKTAKAHIESQLDALNAINEANEAARRQFN